MISVLPFLAVSWIELPDTEQMVQLSSDLEAVQTANADTVALELARCAAEKLRFVIPEGSALGDRAKASDTLEEFLDDCGLANASQDIKQMLREASPEDSEETLDRKTAVAFVFPMMSLTILTNRTFQIEYELTVPEMPVEVPRPSKSENEPQVHHGLDVR